MGLDLKGCYNGNKSIANTVFNVHGCHAENLTSVPIRQYYKKNLLASKLSLKSYVLPRAMRTTRMAPTRIQL